MEAVVFLFILDKFNNSLPSTPFQLLIIILSCNSQIVFLSYKDQHPLAPKPSKILYTRIHPRIKRREGVASKSWGRERERERERKRQEGLLLSLGRGRGRERGRRSGRGGCWWLGLLGGINFSVYSTFFEPVRFDSVRVNRFLHYKTENRTEPGFFLTILISLIGFFSRFDFFS